MVKHPLIKAVGFTGSLVAGRALFNLCASRPEPIPFFGEMGSINPVFLLPSAAKNRGADIGTAWAASLTMGAGQFCTNPGVVVGVKGEMDAFINSAVNALTQASSQVMLTDAIANSYEQRVDKFMAVGGVNALVSGASNARDVTPSISKTTAIAFLKEKQLHGEVFGPFGLIVEADNHAQLLDVATSLEGQITCTMHMDDADTSVAAELMPTLERKAGRVIVNGFPTAVEVSKAMVHGVPYPTSTNFGATSVDTLSIRLFLRPVCYQNVPDALVTDW